MASKKVQYIDWLYGTKIFGEEIGSIHIKILYFNYVRLGGIPDIAWVILTKIWLFPETNGV